MTLTRISNLLEKKKNNTVLSPMRYIYIHIAVIIIFSIYSVGAGIRVVCLGDAVCHNMVYFSQLFFDF